MKNYYSFGNVQHRKWSALGPKRIAPLIISKEVRGKITSMVAHGSPRDLDFELELLGTKPYHGAILYATEFLKHRWDILERRLLKEKLVHAILLYALTVVRKPWPEAEPLIATSKYGFAYMEAFYRNERFYAGEAHVFDRCPDELIQYMTRHDIRERLPHVEHVLTNAPASVVESYITIVSPKDKRIPELDIQLMIARPELLRRTAIRTKSRIISAEHGLIGKHTVARKYIIGVLKHAATPYEETDDC